MVIATAIWHGSNFIGQHEVWNLRTHSARLYFSSDPAQDHEVGTSS